MGEFENVRDTLEAGSHTRGVINVKTSFFFVVVAFSSCEDTRRPPRDEEEEAVLAGGDDAVKTTEFLSPRNAWRPRDLFCGICLVGWTRGGDVLSCLTRARE